VRRVAATLGAVAALLAVALPAAAQAQPAIVSAVAVSLTEVRVYFNEAVDPASVQPTDFALSMADSERPVTAASAGGTVATISSNSAWFNGEAGSIHLTGPGAIADTAGTPSAQTDTVKVGAAPGDFIAPTVQNLRITPGKIRCFCGRKVSIVFGTSQDAYRGFLTVYRGGSKVGVRRIVARPGRNDYHFDGRINGRLLNRGNFRLQVSVVDLVGNLTPVTQSPSRKLKVG
jgi:Big-like domain-containing protein